MGNMITIRNVPRGSRRCNGRVTRERNGKLSERE